jgi:hypothetical protein
LAFDDGEPDLDQVPDVGVKWIWILGFAASQAFTLGCLWAA